METQVQSAALDKGSLPTTGFKQRRVRMLMAKFLRIFPLTCGNVTATCEQTNISRRTAYRWINGTAPVHRQFQRKLAMVRGEDRLLDAAEMSIQKKIADGDVAATIFTLKTKGKYRGWSERPDVMLKPDLGPAATETSLLHAGQTFDQIKTGIERRAADKNVPYAEEVRFYLQKFGERLPPEVKQAFEKEISV